MAGYKNFTVQEIKLAMLDRWLDAHENLVWIVSLSSILMFFGTMVGVGITIVFLPSDHFVKEDDKSLFVNVKNPWLRILYLIVKNAIGVLFIVAGLVMLLLPGQGLLSLLVGLSLTDFPRKRRVIRFIVKRKAVMKSANWLRKKFNRPPLQEPR